MHEVVVKVVEEEVVVKRYMVEEEVVVKVSITRCQMQVL